MAVPGPLPGIDCIPPQTEGVVPVRSNKAVALGHAVQLVVGFLLVKQHNGPLAAVTLPAVASWAFNCSCPLSGSCF